ncbi:sugar kinase [Candidatus Endobugula sertula]|uniref:Sugar kinase n=1 Tax=Candidatus Endobugula sertula TaxID=62101 RepID=A0A1D2QSW7_9GAMM|nr:sugar kinase [Candidatus Endobugula sertula]
MAYYHIYGIGAALVDTEIEVTDTDLQNYTIEKGVMTLVDEVRQTELINRFSTHLIASKRASGGSAANTIIGASYFGANTFYSCKVANDENGNFYLQDMEAAGVVTNKNHNDDGITGKCLVMITPDAERTMNTFLGISETVSTNELDKEALKQSQYAYIEGYLVTSETGRAAAIQLREWAESHNIKTALSLSDPAIVQFFRDGLRKMIGNKVNLLFCNHDEALSFTDTDNTEDAIEALKNYADEFAITLGSKGALIYDGNTTINISANTVKAIDTNGAGDMFAGAFLYAITHGYNHQQAGDLASAASAKIVSQYGPRLKAEQHAEILHKTLG